MTHTENGSRHEDSCRKDAFLILSNNFFFNWNKWKNNKKNHLLNWKCNMAART